MEVLTTKVPFITDKEIVSIRTDLIKIKTVWPDTKNASFIYQYILDLFAIQSLKIYVRILFNRFRIFDIYLD